MAKADHFKAGAYCYFGANGRVCADSDFKTEDEAWRTMLGWPTKGEVREAKKRGDKVLWVTLEGSTCSK